MKQGTYNFIIVSEASQTYLEMLKDTSTGSFFSFSTASTINEIKKVLSKEEIGIVLYDITSLPLSDRNTLFKELSKSEEPRYLEIIAVIDTNDSFVLKELVSQGITDFIFTPIERDYLVLKLQSIMKRCSVIRMIMDECTYFRQAAQQEEQLSSKILDQNLYLKKVYSNITSVNKQLEKNNRELEKVAKYDTLSGLLNRLSLFHTIDIEIDRAVRTESNLTAIMLDIDHFKNINDNFGHQCGDNVIQKIGSLLKQGLRKYDRAGRYGGEEFFIILPNSNIENSIAIAERFRTDIEANTIPCENNEIKITASFGVSEYKRGESRESWISRVDKAMYMAKQAGRNKVQAE